MQQMSIDNCFVIRKSRLQKTFQEYYPLKEHEQNLSWKTLSSGCYVGR